MKSLKLGLGCVIIIQVLVISSGLAQTPRTDSLLLQLKKEGDHPTFGTLYELLFEYAQTDYPRALDYAERAKRAALLEGDSLHITKGLRTNAHLLLTLGKTIESIDTLLKAVKIAKRNSFTLEYIYSLEILGFAYHYIGFYDKAMETFGEALKLPIPKDIKIEILTNLGANYYKFEDTKNARECYHQALQLYGVSPPTSTLIHNLAVCEIKDGNYPEAKKLIAELCKCNPNCSPKTTLIYQLTSGILAKKQSKYIEALVFLDSANQMAKKLNSTLIQIEALYLSGEVCLKIKNHERAKRYISEAEALSLATGYNFGIIKSYQLLSTLYVEMQDFKNASNYQQKYIILNDSIAAGERRINLLKTHVDFAEQENQEKIAAQKEILSLREEAINRQQNLNILIGLLAALAMVVALILVKQIRDKNSINTTLEKKVIERTKNLEETSRALMKGHFEIEQLIMATTKDLQGPLASMRGLSQIFVADAGNESATLENIKQLQCIIKTIAALQVRLSSMHSTKS